MDDLGGLSVITRRQQDQSQRRRCDAEAQYGVTRSQGLWAASRNWKRQGNRWCLEPPERAQPPAAP